MENQIQRGEVYFIYLDPSFGREIGGYKTRPVVVVSINDIHQQTRIVMVVPGTSTPPNKPSANVVRVQGGPASGLPMVTFFNCHQLRAVDQGRMHNHASGKLPEADFKRILAGIRYSLALSDRP